MIKLKAGKSVTSQLREIGLNDELEIMFQEKLPHIVRALCSKLTKNEGLHYEFQITNNSTIIKRIK